MKGDPGPYGNGEGDVWVPRTVPYLEARHVAREWGFYEGDRDRLVYIGKENADLLGFTRDCFCDEVCEDAPRDEYGETTGEPGPCRVPAWHFELGERW